MTTFSLGFPPTQSSGIWSKHGDPSWASCEGTAIDPVTAALSGKGVDIEGYLGRLFNHGGVLVNLYGWGVGDDSNPFRKTAEGENALVAYRKFLAGETLHQAPAILLGRA